VEALYTKVKEGSDQEITDFLEEGKKHNCCGSENSSTLFRRTLEERLNYGSLFEVTLNYKSEKYRSAKKRVFERVLR